MRLTEEIYVYEWTNPMENNCNSFYIGGTVRALIDPGLKRFFPDLLKSLEDDGIGRDDIRHVILTHSHPDHFEASELFNGEDVLIGMHRQEISFHAGTGAVLYNWFGIDFPKTSINMPLDSGEAMLGDQSFRILLVPGHSPGSLALYWPEKKALFSGDVIFDRNVGRSDFPGGDTRLLKKSIRALSELDTEILLPGHMGIVEGGDAVKRNFEMVIRQIFPYM